MDMLLLWFSPRGKSVFFFKEAGANNRFIADHIVLCIMKYRKGVFRGVLCHSSPLFLILLFSKKRSNVA